MIHASVTHLSRNASFIIDSMSKPRFTSIADAKANGKFSMHFISIHNRLTVSPYTKGPYAVSAE